MPTDRLQSEIAVGQVVNVPIIVTAIGGTSAQPTITGTTKHKNFAGANTSIGPVDAIQVVVDH